VFEGFSEKTSEFLWGLALNNEKSWFEAHRAEYEKYLRAPFHDLAVQTAALMEQRFPKAGLKLRITRIYRDARRLHGKGPYKDHLWFTLIGDREDTTGPGFWFEIGPADYSYGMGTYAASADKMEAHRKSIAANPARMEGLAKMFEKQDLFVLGEEDYKKPKGDMGELLNKWYNKKQIELICRKEFGEELFSPELPQTLLEGYSFLMPYYEFFSESMFA